MNSIFSEAPTKLIILRVIIAQLSLTVSAVSIFLKNVPFDSKDIKLFSGRT
jgi:hypothetical protein